MRWKTQLDRQIGFYNLREDVGIKNEKQWNAVIWSLEQKEKDPETKARTWRIVENAKTDHTSDREIFAIWRDHDVGR